MINFDERAAYVFGLARPALLQRVALDARPATALFGVDGALLVAPANQAIARTIDLDHGADGQVNPLPSPMTRWALGADDASVYGVAAGASSVHRFAWPYLQERRVRDAWPEVSHRVLPIAVAATEAALFVADAAPGASRLWALDPATLEVRRAYRSPRRPRTSWLLRATRSWSSRSRAPCSASASSPRMPRASRARRSAPSRRAHT